MTNPDKDAMGSGDDVGRAQDPGPAAEAAGPGNAHARRPAADPAKVAEAYAEAVGTDAPPLDPIDAELAALVADDADDPRTREELLAALHENEKLLAESEDDHLRIRAEFANFRRRTERDAMHGRVQGRIDILTPILDVLDDFDRTVAAAATSPDEGLRSGVGLVRDKLATVLAAQGLVRIDEADVAFDPNRHEAVQTVEAEDGPLDVPQVAEVYRAGYLLGDRVLRAAMVVVRQ